MSAVTPPPPPSSPPAVVSERPQRLFSVDAGLFTESLLGHNVVVPVEWEWAPFRHLGTTATLLGGLGTGPGAGLWGGGARVGLKWFPLSTTPFEGFSVQGQAGADLIVSTTDPVFGGVRPSVHLGLGYALRVVDRWIVSPGLGVNLNLFGWGFPSPGVLLFHLNIGRFEWE